MQNSKQNKLIEEKNNSKEGKEMLDNGGTEICPKHRVVMKNGVCRVCQAEMYDKFYRKYGEPNAKLVEEKEKAHTSGERFKARKDGSKPDRMSRPATESDLQRLVDKFNKKK